MVEELTACAQRHLPEALGWLRRMVAINSFTNNPAGVDELGRLTAECFARLGMDVRRVPAADTRHGAHGFFSTGPPEPPVVLVTHLDTVFAPDEEARHRFAWREEEGRIYGPGVVDNKGGTVLIWLMLSVMKECLPALWQTHRWLVAANSAEEVVSGDFARALEAYAPLGCVLVFEGGRIEPDGFHLVSARKGRREYRLTCRGRGAHAGSDFGHGINALVELAGYVPQLAALSDVSRGLTVNVAKLAAGGSLNRVPHEAVLELEMRAFDPLVLAEAGAAVESHAGTTPGGAQVQVELLGATPAWPGGPATDRLVACWAGAASELGGAVVATARGGLSDANYLCHLAPTLDGLGPSGGHAHCSEWSDEPFKRPEFLESHSLVAKAVLNLVALVRLLGHGHETQNGGDANGSAEGGWGFA